MNEELDAKRLDAEEEQPDTEPIKDTWAEAQAGRNKKTYRWYMSVIGEILLSVPLILALILLRRLFG